MMIDLVSNQRHCVWFRRPPFPFTLLPIRAAAPPTEPYNLEDKSMKKFAAILILAGLGTIFLISQPVSSQGEQGRLHKKANKIENSYIVVLDDSVVGERGRFSIAP